jgi:hypothetical protein
VHGVTSPVSVRLGIDFGTTHTVAVLQTSERAEPLLFDSSPLLSSAVFAGPDGGMLTGRDGERSARLDPTRYEPNPKRRIDEAAVLLGDREHPVAQIIAAVLTRVATEAVRAVGGPPAQTVLTYPATWAAPRKDVLARAAAAAGLRPVTLVPEPVAAAAHFTTVLGHTVNPGDTLAVYDFGAGTFDASVVRRGPGGGWEVLASEGLNDVGGLDLDAALVERIGQTLGGRDLPRWYRLTNPGTDAERRAARAFWEDVRAAKEQLSRAPSAAVQVPLFDTDTHLTREEFEATARPLIARTVDLTASLLSRAGPTRLAGVYLVGGSSRIPLVATLLHQRIGVAPTLIDQPELVVARGSLAAVAPPAAPAPPMAARPIPMPAPPAPMPMPAPPMPAPPMGVPAPAAHMGAPAPVSGSPAGGIPVSSIPTSGPPTGPVSGAPTGPTSGPPVSGAAFSGPPVPPAGVPLWGSPAPQAPPPRQARRGRVRWVIPAVLALVVVAGCLGVVKVRDWMFNGKRTANSQRTGSGQNGTGNTNNNGGGGAIGGGGGKRQQVDVNRAVWYAGKKITLGRATYDPADEEPLQVDVSMENLATRDDNTLNGLQVYFGADGQNTEGDLKELSTLPGGTTSKGTFSFRLTKPVTNLKAGVLTIGRSDTVQAVVPFGDPKTGLTLEPKKVLPNPVEHTVGVLTFKVTSCEQRADFPAEHKQVKKGSYMVVCLVDVKSNKTSIYDHGVWESAFRLKVPDGTVVAPTDWNTVLLNQNQQERDQPVGFTIRWPAPGAYTLQVLDAGRLGNEPPPPGGIADIPITLT